MKTISYLILFVVAALVFGCDKDALQQAAPGQDRYDPQLYIQKAEQALSADAAAQASLDFRTDPVVVPAGSVDALQEAVEAAGEGGTVLLEAGLHTESGTVQIFNRVRIQGEEGAVLEFDSEDTPGFPFVADPGLHVRDAKRVVIEGLTIMDADTSGSVGVLIESTYLTRIRDNRFIGFEHAIVNHFGDATRIHDNEFLEPKGLDGYNLLNLNGKDMYIYNNRIRTESTGSFVGDDGGLMVNNYYTSEGGDIGALFCTPNLGGVWISLPSGEMAVAENSANDWLVWRNYAENFVWNYLVIDNANNNILVNNRSGSSVLADIELAGDSERFGFFTPQSFDNLVLSQGEPDVSIKVCGEGNFALGGKLVDNGESPCN